MKFVFASDSFKGTITSTEAAHMLTEAAQTVFGSVECVSLPVADGGEGTVQAVVEATGGSYVSIDVQGPLFTPVSATYGIIGQHQAIIEMAAASGLPLVPAEQRNPMLTTTYGTGQLILDALDRGISDIYIAIGGSATSDGGIGCLCALGARFLDADGHELAGTGADLIRIHSIDLSRLDPRLASARFTIMCDVTNPLCGPRGAVYTYAAQKGATPAMQDALEQGMLHYRDLLISLFHTDPDLIPGAGAAGGLGAALRLFLHAQMQSGIDTVLHLTHFDSIIADADLVITGEGRTDWQSAQGKVLSGIGQHCSQQHIPAVALVGGLGQGWEDILSCGITAVMPTTPSPIPLDEALANAIPYYRSAALRLMMLIKTGMMLK